MGTTNTETGRARLRKYVVTENVTQTVPVSHEEVRVEREPITDANRDAAMSGPDISEEEVVVSKQAVPKERVRLTKDTVTDEQQVSETVHEQETVGGEVRKEQIELDDESGTGRRGNHG